MTMTRPMSRHPCARGFSLVELLVVTAIVAVLAGLLLPAMGRARQKSVQSACLSNLRHAGLGFTLYLGDHSDRFPDARSLKAALGYRPWTDWPQSDPRAGWAPIALRHHGDPRIWLCPAIARSPLQKTPQVVQSPAPDTAASLTSYWLWRFDRTNDPVPLDNFWNKSADQALLDLRAANNPVVGQPPGPSDVELAVDVYFPATLPGVSPNLAGRAAHPGGRNRLMLDQSASWTRDPRLTIGR
jgi:prepilin-type N-terminal cleavage/methylation domain-containing protein